MSQLSDPPNGLLPLETKPVTTRGAHHQQYRVRRATSEDLAQITYIARITWNTTYSNTIAVENRHEFLERAYKPAHLADAIQAPGHWFYVAERDDTVVGFSHFLKRYHPNQARAELVRLYVLPTHQNEGIGTFILKTGFAALAEAGISQCFVSVQATNSLARKFYERHGFRFKRTHGQFLGTQIITLVEYARPITAADATP
jgi:ribosomal protein S18 acetylase RimI-like enzyme